MSIVNEALMAAIRDRLAVDRRIAGLPIDVCAADGVVSLKGFVETLDQKQLAVNLVIGVIGVRDVEDELIIRGEVPVKATMAQTDTWVAV